MSSLEPIGVPYTDDFLTFKQTQTQHNSCEHLHILGTHSIITQPSSRIHADGEIQKAPSGANGSIVMYKSLQRQVEKGTVFTRIRKIDKNILIKFRAADTRIANAGELKIVDIQDPTQYDIVNAILLDALVQPIKPIQFTKVLTCSQSKLQGQNSLSTALFIESVPGNVQSLMTYLNKNKTYTPEDEKKVLTLMLQLLRLGEHIGFWHGDLHPGNILVKEEDSSFVLIDLGRAYIHPPFFAERIQYANINTITDALKNACAKLWTCDRWQFLDSVVSNITLENIYDEHILKNAFKGNYSYFNRHGHLMQFIKKNGGPVHPNVYKTVVLADISGLALSIFSQSYLGGKNICSLKGLVALMNAYMPQVTYFDTITRTWIYGSSQISILNNFINITNPYGLLKRIHECHLNVSISDNFQCLKEMICLWLLLYTCIVRELLIELPKDTRILPSGLNKAVTHIVNSLANPRVLHNIDDDIVKFAFYAHGQPEMFTCDMFAILNDMWKTTVRLDTIGGSKVFQKRSLQKSATTKNKGSSQRKMQIGGQGNANASANFMTGLQEEVPQENTFDYAMIAALEYKAQLDDSKKMVKPDRIVSTQIHVETQLFIQNQNQTSKSVSVGAGRTFLSEKKNKKKTSDTYRYKQRDYVVYEGSRGGRYIRLKGEYVSIRLL